jgi:hypothetical protein
MNSMKDDMHVSRVPRRGSDCPFENASEPSFWPNFVCVVIGVEVIRISTNFHSRVLLVGNLCGDDEF